MSHRAANAHHAHLELASALARILERVERVERGTEPFDANQCQVLAQLPTPVAQASKRT